MGERTATKSEPVSEIERLRAELKQWTQWGVIEVAVRNPQVSEWMNHHEQRTIKAESKIADLLAALEKIANAAPYGYLKIIARAALAKAKG